MAVAPGDKVVYMNERIVGEAEKEASEVLHSLLSVERIEKPNRLQNIQQVVVLNSNGEEIQWHNNGIQHHESIFTVDNGEYSHQDSAIVWDNTLTLDVETSAHPAEQIVVSDILEETFVQPQAHIKGHGNKKVGHKWQRKASKPPDDTEEIVVEDTGDSDDANDVRQRFKMGCECQDDSCFRGLNPDNVYRHRLNIAELTKEEHDMYLMGVTMACMSDPGVTVKRRERRRLRAQYVYQGRRVCLAAFLYLENCTLYQLKRIRKHVMTHGVTPRVHGNHGKKPHNVFSLETYRRATDFLKQYIDHHNTNTGNCKNSVIFPPEISKKTIHNSYLEYLRVSAPPDEKTMGYSTFRHFMKEQFPHVRFCKVELGTQTSNSFSSLSCKHQTTSNNNLQTQRTSTTEDPCTLVVQSQTATATTPVQTLSTIPLLIHEQQNKAELAAQTTYIVTPMSQLVQTPYQAAHTITVTPLTNYAFTTM